MLYSILAFTLTLLELGTVLVAFFMRLKVLFAEMLIYGSPLYMLQNIDGSASSLYHRDALFMAFLAFHLIKYFTLHQAYHKDDENIPRNFALLFEGIYIGLSTYYLFYLGGKLPVFIE